MLADSEFRPMTTSTTTLESGADDSPCGGDRNGFDTAISIAKPSAEEGAKKGARQVVQRSANSSKASFLECADDPRALFERDSVPFQTMNEVMAKEGRK